MWGVGGFVVSLLGGRGCLVCAGGLRAGCVPGFGAVVEMARVFGECWRVVAPAVGAGVRGRVGDAWCWSLGVLSWVAWRVGAIPIPVAALPVVVWWVVGRLCACRCGACRVAWRVIFGGFVRFRLRHTIGALRGR